MVIFSIVTSAEKVNKEKKLVNAFPKHSKQAS